MVKRLPTMWETWVQSLGWKDPLEKGTEAQPTPVFLPGELHGQRSLVATVHGVAESDTTERFHFHFQTLISYIICKIFSHSVILDEVMTVGPSR